MKPFNLEEAINGKAFYLENGYRGVIKYCVDDFITYFEQPPHYPYVGYVLDDKGFLFTAHTAWNENGKSNEYPSFNATTMVDDTPLQDNKKETMKKFDLKAALNGEHVMLRNGKKAFVVYDLRNYPVLMGELGKKPLNGIVFNEDGDECKYIDVEWNEAGSNASVQFDIIGMWEEPKKQINIEDLPKPFKPNIGDEFFYLSDGMIRYFSFYADSAANFARNGQCFRTEEDAQKWLDFMKSMME